MQIKLTYSELCTILNHYVAGPSESEKMKYTFLPTGNGIIIKFGRLKWQMLNLKKEVQAEFVNFDSGELEIKIEINGFLLDLLKKFIMQMLYKTLKYQLKEDEIQLEDYLYISKSTLYIQLNQLLRMMGIPFAVESLRIKKEAMDAKIQII